MLGITTDLVAMIPLKDNNPTHRTPWVTRTLIGLCVCVFIYQLVLSTGAENRLIYQAGAIPSVILGTRNLSPDLATVWPSWTSLFSSLFLHGGFMHLAGNMMFLWVFGDNVEDAMGHWRFIAFYLICGVLATGAHIALDPTSTTPLIGASGAISGVLGAYILLYPKAKVTAILPLGFIFIPFRLAAWIVLGFWFALQIFNVLSSGDSNVAWMAHIGGFVAGMAGIVIFKDRNHRLFTDGHDVYVGPWSRRAPPPDMRFNRPYRSQPTRHAVPVTRPDEQDAEMGQDSPGKGPWGPRR